MHKKLSAQFFSVTVDLMLENLKLIIYKILKLQYDNKYYYELFAITKLLSKQMYVE